ncbi:hypothetical protein BGZ94_005738 [Podila epigama]|nr:hypothetical protein BGZ94_005738 [Podila epigama]
MTVEQFTHNEKKQVLWFSAPPLDVVPVTKPHHSVEYLAKKQKLTHDARKTGGNDNSSTASKPRSESTSVEKVDGGRQSGNEALNLEQMKAFAENALPVVLHGLDALKDQLNADIKVIQSN